MKDLSGDILQVNKKLQEYWKKDKEQKKLRAEIDTELNAIQDDLLIGAGTTGNDNLDRALQSCESLINYESTIFHNSFFTPEEGE